MKSSARGQFILSLEENGGTPEVTGHVLPHAVPLSGWGRSHVRAHCAPDAG